MPAASVPLWWSNAGLPLGGDARVLQLAAQLERAESWHARRPPGI
jgi:Asp-tRNA(Asn)/Glu-tRNA(Gln) amidotransferase A subunit family amidase